MDGNLAKKLQSDFPLKEYTTLRVGGPARFLVSVETEEEIVAAVRFAEEKGLPFFVLGGGSNILIADSGFAGLVIKMDISGVSYTEMEGGMVVTAGAGESWDAIVEQCVERGLWGIENLSGIPGTVGAAPVQNIGCYGAEVATVLESVRAYDTQSGEMRELRNRECGFAYRDSTFKKEAGRYIITDVTLRLSYTGTPNLSYHDVKSFFESENTAIPTALQVRRAIIMIRDRKGMVFTPGQTSLKTAGSFFKAPPLVSRSVLERVEGIVTTENPTKAESLAPWWWERPGDRYKIAPAFLMEFTPFNKTDFAGKTWAESVGISPVHTLSLINVNDARAADIRAFAEHIQRTVYDKFGVMLEPEVQYIGVF